MSQADEQQTDKRETDEVALEHERASGTELSGIYISEAQSSDQGLFDGWRSNMDGLLIFAGLFSAVVTRFIVESYKTLKPDLGSQTVALLTQILHQLADLSNGTAVTDALPPPAAFSPPLSSIICNALWFTRLALSLASAFIATLVKHRAQDFPHRTGILPAIFAQSRMYICLRGGLRRFDMHFVASVPLLLLHATLDISCAS
ncbi:unnamed protein product [Mycena citricolor]|uniref:DUF6535 domain-containing protein n=1 Tax=Mycena citricolor TaxID=2018698 RepID=A0AAD2GTN6_9AGAR|nr:unnamed protein product [Mycena citricolor]